MKFLTLCPGGGAFDSLFRPEGRVSVHNDYPEGVCSLQVVSRGGGGGMVLVEIDTCII